MKISLLTILSPHFPSFVILFAAKKIDVPVRGGSRKRIGTSVRGDVRAHSNAPLYLIVVVRYRLEMQG
jgi:hypothetical protein